MRFTPAEIIGPIAGFGMIAAIAVGMLVVLLRHIPDTPCAIDRTPEAVHQAH
jgi:hypothetical protein